MRTCKKSIDRVDAVISDIYRKWSKVIAWMLLFCNRCSVARHLLRIAVPCREEFLVRSDWFCFLDCYSVLPVECRLWFSPWFLFVV